MVSLSKPTVLINILWPKNAGRIRAFVLKPYDGLKRHFYLSEIQLQKRCYTWVEHLNTYERGLASSALPIILLHAADTDLLISLRHEHEIFRTVAFYDTWEQIPRGICNPIEHAIYLSIGNSSSLPFGAFPEELPILFFTGSVEPIRVLHQRWRV